MENSNEDTAFGGPGGYATGKTALHRITSAVQSPQEKDLRQPDMQHRDQARYVFYSDHGV